MKKTSLIIIILLALAVAALYVLHFTGIGGEASGPEKSDQEISQTPAGSIVYIRIDTLLNKYDLFLDLQSDLSAKARIVEDDLTKKGRAFENDVNNFQEKVQKGLITRSQAETQQNQLAARQQELEQYAQQKQLELAEENQVMLNRVLDALRTFLSEYRVMKNYDMILTTDGNSNTVIEASRGLDITQEVVDGLNQEYAKSRK
ncbi:MAG: OmpH family outer membrane protein [Bacteroidales bacterium]|jgi:outer membrane protein|nr:OmpH family outer membrane protein [Bacteroidales bacterium]MDD2264112.1 OmpH family outer membrane protein [Bacteroidales bacterium]MDD2831417.1 OmpH family outer membrane protein [Bacteroidales bacterium]MDD3208411.1 OmpH family outer membrane protein [Bacteroidales bacterium]MDD3696906.1 OmpH family outer membrane protein [Bacteroidales bacterium]